MNELNSRSPISGDTSNYSDAGHGGTVKQAKKTLSFKPLEEAKKDPAYFISDFGKADASDLHIAFQALDEFVVEYDRLPKPWSINDSEIFLKLPAVVHSEVFNVILLTLFAKTCAGELCPINATIGGTIAQEVMKACSGKLTPIQQYLYFDAIECLPDTDLTEIDCKALGTRYDKQIAVFGGEFQKRLANLQYFIDGAGAIG